MQDFGVKLMQDISRFKKCENNINHLKELYVRHARDPAKFNIMHSKTNIRVTKTQKFCHFIIFLITKSMLH